MRGVRFSELLPLSRRFKDVGNTVGLYGLWALLAALFGALAYQLYAALLYVGVVMVENPTTRPTGWNTATLSGLSKLLILVLGAAWLMAVSLLERCLREGMAEHRLTRRVCYLLLGVAVTWALSYGLILLPS
jgi:hypothetical protein